MLRVFAKKKQRNKGPSKSTDRNRKKVKRCLHTRCINIIKFDRRSMPTSVRWGRKEKRMIFEILGVDINLTVAWMVLCIDFFSRLPAWHGPRCVLLEKYLKKFLIRDCSIERCRKHKSYTWRRLWSRGETFREILLTKRMRKINNSHSYKEILLLHIYLFS